MFRLDSITSIIAIVIFLLGVATNIIECNNNNNIRIPLPQKYDNRAERLVKWIKKGFLFEDFTQLADFRADYFNLNIESDPNIVRWRATPEMSLYFDNISVFGKIDKFLVKKRICFRDNILNIREFVEEFRLESFMRDKTTTTISDTPSNDRQNLAFQFAPVIKIYLYLVADKCFELLKSKKRLERANEDLDISKALKTFKYFIDMPDQDLKDCYKQQMLDMGDKSESQNCLSTEVMDLNTLDGRKRYSKKISNFLDTFGVKNKKNKDVCSRFSRELNNLVFSQQRDNWQHLRDSCAKLERWYKNSIDPISISLSMTAIESQEKYLQLLRENPDSSLKKWSEISAWCNIVLRTEVNLTKNIPGGSRVEKQIKFYDSQRPIDYDNNEYLAYVWNDSLKYLDLSSLQKSIFFGSLGGLVVTAGAFAIASGGAGLAVQALISGVMSITSPIAESFQQWCAQSD